MGDSWCICEINITDTNPGLEKSWVCIPCYGLTIKLLSKAAGTIYLLYMAKVTPLKLVSSKHATAVQCEITCLAYATKILL